MSYPMRNSSIDWKSIVKTENPLERAGFFFLFTSFQSLPLMREVDSPKAKTEGENPSARALPQSPSVTAPSPEGAFRISALSQYACPFSGDRVF